MGINHRVKKKLEVKINDKPTQNPAQIASAFNNHFIESVAEIVQTFPSVTETIVKTDNSKASFCIQSISELKTKAIINSLKTSTAKDAYRMDSAMLKSLKDHLASPIAQIINLSILQGTFPNSWKTAIVSPIFKSGDPQNISNYRPISILPVASKVAEKWISEQLVSFLNNSEFNLHPMQFGFRANYSTETANCLFVDNVRAMVDKGGVVGAVFLDLRKAFDTVNHKVLLCKLSSFNFSPLALRWFESYLTGRCQHVAVNNQLSPALELHTGVPQGSILGPLLFSLYINDLPSVCPDVETLLYADDTVMYVHAKTKQLAAAKLTSALEQISKWLNCSCLQLNLKKTVGMFFTKRQCNIASNITISGHNIDIVSEVKYLGITIDSNLTFKKHIKKVSQRIRFSLANFKYIRNTLTLKAAKLYMNAMIMSHITYCLTSWGQTNSSTLKPLEMLYKQTLKVLDQKPNSSHHCTILHKHKLLCWEDLIKYRNICLVFKILRGLAPPPLNTFITQRNNTGQITRSATRGDLTVPFRKSTFGQLSFSVKALQNWNSLPTHIKEIHTYCTFTSKLKIWLTHNQTCTH